MRAPDKTMTCAEFQETLPELFESQSGLTDHEHLTTCENCAALVRDLEYIASQARLLLPIHDPSPAVWDNIQQALRQEKPGSSASAARK
ncbi:MAG TPA: hypothetical protein VHX37_00805 [Acidobacteriaceae bacterium]|nr:hypothetical protein [Acidobacteriaceae bacterium]